LFRFLLSRLSFNHFLLEFWLLFSHFHLLLLSLLLNLFFDLFLDLFFDNRLFLSLCLFRLLDLLSYGRLLLFLLGLSLHGFCRVCYSIWLGRRLLLFDLFFELCIDGFKESFLAVIVVLFVRCLIGRLVFSGLILCRGLRSFEKLLKNRVKLATEDFIDRKREPAILGYLRLTCGPRRGWRSPPASR
jgi:hypothetical protein